MSSLRLTDTTRKVMIQHRRVVFSPGEGLNELIDRMPAVLNPVSLPQTVQCHPTPTESLEAQTWWRQYFGVAPCLFQSNIPTTSPIFPHNPNPWMLTPSHHLVRAPPAPVFAGVQKAGSKIWVFSLLLGGTLHMQCERMSLLGRSTGRERDPNQPSYADFYAFWSPQPSPTSINPYQRLLPDNSVRNAGRRGVGVVKLVWPAKKPSIFDWEFEA